MLGIFTVVRSGQLPALKGLTIDSSAPELESIPFSSSVNRIWHFMHWKVLWP